LDLSLSGKTLGKNYAYEQIIDFPPAGFGKNSNGGGIGGLSPSWRGVIEESRS
jgi:hypothetical protein